MDDVQEISNSNSSSISNWWNDYDFDKPNWSSDENVANVKQAFDLVENKFEQEIESESERRTNRRVSATQRRRVRAKKVATKVKSWSNYLSMFLSARPRNW
jgi:uncharacterized protein YktA (UPF0223 family)